MGRARLLTAGGGGFRVGKEDDAILAFVDKLLQSRLLSILSLDVASEPFEIDRVANRGLLRFRCTISRGCCGLG